MIINSNRQRGAQGKAPGFAANQQNPEHAKRHKLRVKAGQGQSETRKVADNRQDGVTGQLVEIKAEKNR